MVRMVTSRSTIKMAILAGKKDRINQDVYSISETHSLAEFTFNVVHCHKIFVTVHVAIARLGQLVNILYCSSSLSL